MTQELMMQVGLFADEPEVTASVNEHGVYTPPTLTLKSPRGLAQSRIELALAFTGEGWCFGISYCLAQSGRGYAPSTADPVYASYELACIEARKEAVRQLSEASDGHYTYDGDKQAARELIDWLTYHA